MSKDAVIRATAFCPEAFSARPLFAGAQSAELTEKITKTRRQNEASRREFSENHAVYKTQIRDYTTLAFSMRRAGNTEAEAAAYFCVGVTYDNMGKYEDAIKGYSKFLKLSREINDKVGECLAYNCMGMCKVREKGAREAGAGCMVIFGLDSYPSLLLTPPSLPPSNFFR